MGKKWGRQKRLSFFPYQGGKHYLLPYILKIIPEHEIYVEPFGGSAKVLLNKPPSKIEVYNDIDKKIANLFYVVAFHFDEFNRKVNNLILSRALFEEFKKEIKNNPPKKMGDVDHAVKTYYLLLTSYAGSPRFNSFMITYKKRTTAFAGNISRLPEIHQRIKNVIFESRDFRKILETYGSKENAFLYIDPPYFGEENTYDADFSERDHRDLLKFLQKTKAKWLLSGYQNKLYDEMLKGFYRVEIGVKKYSMPVSKFSKSKTRPDATEVLWANYNIKKMLEK